MSEDPSLAAGSAGTLTLTECLYRAGRVMYGAEWIFGLSPTERARMVQYSKGTLPADPAIRAKVEGIRDQDGLARVQRRQVLLWIESCGFSTAGGTRIDEAAFERALARDFARHGAPMPRASDPPAGEEDGRVLPWWRRREHSIVRFAERQNRVRQWLAFREIADWCARATTGASIDNEETARRLAYQRLDQSARNGEFDRNERCRGTAMKTARSKILYLDTYIAGELRTPKRCRLSKEQIELVEDIRDLGARCWLPRELARQWLGVHGYPWPRHFEPTSPNKAQPGPMAEPPTARAGEADIATMPTGAPGRPSKGMHLIWTEFERRLAENACKPSLREEASVLLQWFRREYPVRQPPTVKTIENKIRNDHRIWRADKQPTEP
jgi:hypothetical protein